MPCSFLLSFPALPRFTKRDLDGGNIADDAAALCDAIRATFFLSRSIRKERTLWLAFAADSALVRMAGATLRYLGPDERSTLMLVDKATDVLDTHPGSPGKWIESTPGVSCMPGIDPGDVLALVAADQPGRMLVDPEFVQLATGARPGIGFSPDLPALMATRDIVVAMSLDGSHAASWAGSAAASRLSEELINARILGCTGSPTLATRILAVNMIDDHASGGGP
ncbi:MAG: hypothetical protein GYA24_10330 [Candidatus Lokiarchaeota archaeon]|nr:hypothetical protein [Candidatus Lokiarchaeota archaeon]